MDDRHGTQVDLLRGRIRELEAEVARLRAGGRAPPAGDPGRAVLESATRYAIFTLDPSRTVTSWNPGAEHLLGWSAAQMVGRSGDDIFTPEDRSAGAPEAEAETARAEGSAEDERWHLRRDGSRFFAVGLLMPLRDGSGGFVKILRDRTDELHAEHGRLRELDRMKALATAARAIVGAPDLAATLQAITDAARDIVGAHQSVCSLTRGPDWSQAINAVSLSDKYAAWRDFADAPSGEGVYAWLCEGNRTARLTQAELEAHPRWRAFGRRGGAHPPMRGWLATALVGGDGENLGLIQLSDKIEGEFDEVDEAVVVQLAQLAASAIERARAWDEVRRGEARLRSVFAIKTVGVLFWSETFGLTDMNDAFLAMTGFTREEALGRTWAELTPEEFHPASRRAVHEVTTRGESTPYEKQYLRKDGSRWWGLFAARRIGNEVVEFVLDVTDRREAEAALRESEARVRELADNIDQFAWTADGDGAIYWYNKRWFDYTGTTPEEMAGWGWTRVHHPDHVDRVVASISHAFRTGEPWEDLFPLRGRDGSYRWFLSRAQPIRDASGRVVHWFGTNTDVTAQRAADEARRESEARLRLAVEAGRMAIWELDLATDTLVPSPELNRLLGLPEEARPTAEEVRALYAPGERERMAGIAAQALARGDRFAEVEYRIRRPDGEVRWLMLRAEIHRDGDGRATRYVGVVLDVTERKAAEIALAEAHAEAEARAKETAAILAQLAEGVIVTDRDGRITFVNEAAARIHGEERLGVPPADYTQAYHLFREDGRPYPAGELPLARAVSGGETVENARWLIRRADGREVVAVGNARPLLAPGGEQAGAVLTVRDDTARATAQAELQRLAATLEARVVERSAELLKTEEALRQAQKMEAIGQLTGGVAHDFNNLLTIIRSSTDLLRRPDLPEDRRRRYVNAISDTVDRAARLTSQLLAFARRQALTPEVFDVPGRLGTVTDMLRTIVGGRIGIQTEITCESCFVEADANQFETALVNMAVNARDAMDGEGTLTIRVESLPEMPALRGHAGGPGPFVAVSIADTGEGIPPERIAKIFEPFFTTKEVGKGTGLGLSQVYGFAKQSGGDVGVESEVGRGTTFTLYLPRASQAEAQAAGPGGGERAQEHGRGRRVLVVEDNREVGEFSTQLLQDLGYETTWAANAAEALEQVEGGRGFDVVFSDVVMPGMSGVELGQEIRRRRPDLPVVLTSGYSHVLAEEGTHGFALLRKPYAVEELSRILRKVARARQG